MSTNNRFYWIIERTTETTNTTIEEQPLKDND